METMAEKECSALGGLFQIIVNDLKVGSPTWEDFLAKAAKLHSTLKATVFALTAFLDAFQKVADLATNARGATKEIGTAMTRLCLRHRGVEAKLKTFSSAIMDNLVIPLQERLEDWRKIAYQMDKDHAKEYKRIHQDIKKKSSDTLRLQKKVRKAGKGDMKKTLDCAIQDVNDKYHLLEDTEKQAVRRALIEERSRYCLFVSCLRPVVESELATLHEVSHLQEVLDALTKLTEDPHTLPSASEQVITDIKGSDSSWSFQTPPSSPTSLGSRKSSMCSISSLNSSSSDSTKSHSPSHHRSRSLSQPPIGALRLTSVSSQDSGFTSQDTLFTRLPTPPPMELTNQVTEFVGANAGAASSTGTPPSPFPPAPCVTSTWPNLQDTLQFERAAASIVKSQRPHTISSAYEKMGHNRPALTAQTFQPLQQMSCAAGDSVNTLISACDSGQSHEEFDPSDGNEDSTPTHKIHTPPVPERGSKLQRPVPKLPEKPQIFKHPTSHASHALASGGFDCNPIYANLGELVSQSQKALLDFHGSESRQSKVAFHKDLAAVLAQNVVLQQRQPKPLPNYNRQLSEPSASSSESFQIDASNKGEDCTNQARNISDCPEVSIAPSKPPPPPVRRSSSLSVQPPMVPPHRSTPGSVVTTASSFRDASLSASKTSSDDTSWNVFSESNESSAAHAQLIQALNARLNVLQQHSDPSEAKKGVPLRNPPPPPPMSETSKPLSSSFTSSHQDSSLGIPDRLSRTDNVQPRNQQTPPQPTRKPARAHSLGGSDRETFIMNLNSKFAQNLSPCSSLKRQDVSPRANKFATNPRNSLPAAQRRASQPVFPENINLGKTMCSPAPEGAHCIIRHHPADLSGFKAPNESQQQQPYLIQPRVDRRSSLNLEQEFGRHSSISFHPQLLDSSIPRDGFEMMEPGQPPMTDAAARVHSWLAGRGSVDLSQCRVSLLGQIRQGINLRKATSNDRSAPFL